MILDMDNSSSSSEANLQMPLVVQCHPVVQAAPTCVPSTPSSLSKKAQSPVKSSIGSLTLDQSTMIIDQEALC